MKKALGIILTFLLLAGLQALLDTWFKTSLINLWLLVITLLSVNQKYSWRLPLLLLAGLTADLTSAAGFGQLTLSLLLTALLIDLLLVNVFTQRSLYAWLSLALLASIFYRFFWLISNFIYQFFLLETTNFTPAFGTFVFWQIIVNCVVIAIFYFLQTALGKKTLTTF